MVRNRVDLLEGWENYLGTKSPTTRRQYVFHVQKLGKFIGKPLKRLNRGDLVDYFQHCSENGNSRRSIKFKSTIIKRFSEWMWEEGHLDEQEYRKIARFCRELRPEKGEDVRVALSKEEEDRVVVAASRPSHKMILWLGLNFGLRRKEIRNLKLEDVDLDGRVLTVKRSKGLKTRRLRVTDRQAGVFSQWFKQLEVFDPEASYVVVRESGGRYTLDAITKLVERIGEKAGVKLYPHMLRYTFATKLLRAGLDIFVISKILGHSNVATTMVYLKVSEGEILDRYEKVASRVF